MEEGLKTFGSVLVVLAVIGAAYFFAHAPQPRTGAASPEIGCAGRDIQSSALWQGATGALAGVLTVSNVSGSACTLVPSSMAIASGGRTLTSTPLSAVPTTLAPGAALQSQFVWRNWCGASFATPSQVVLYFNGTSSTASVRAGGAPDAPRCDDPTASSTLSAGAFSAAVH